MIDTETDKESEMKSDEEMMILLKMIANSVTKMIKGEEDFPSRHQDGQLPMLDLKIHVDRTDRDEPIKFRFYQKPVANKSLVSAYTTLPWGMMYSTLVEEGVR